MSGVIASDGSWAPRFHEGKAEVREEEMFSPASNAVSDRYRLIPPLRKVKVKSGVEVLAVNPDQRRRAYQVTFIGRETVRFPSRQTQSIVAIDRIEAIRRLP